MITQLGRVLLSFAVATAVTTSYPTHLDAGETTDSSISSPGWRCDLQQRKLLGEHTRLGRQVARLARTATGCRVIVDRFELCEPVHLRTHNAAAEEFTAAGEPIEGKRLCAALDCDSDDADSTGQVVALDDAFGRRSVTTGAVDRFCVDLN